MIKYNEAQSIRKTYEQIVRRLAEERVGFDNQLAAIERSLAAKQRDFEELLLLSGDSNHARETALGELERVRASYEDERKRRGMYVYLSLSINIGVFCWIVSKLISNVLLAFSTSSFR